MRRGPLLGGFIFLACTVGGYKLGVMRRDARLQRERESAAREAPKSVPRPIEPVAISTEALSEELPSDIRRAESVPKVLE